jgi:alkyl hydroperoxide reductase subunit D
MSSINTDSLDLLLESRATPIARDLKLNLKRLLQEGTLEPEEGLLAMLATSISAHCDELAGFARSELAQRALGPELIREAEESAAMMGMLNIYYRFRHFVGKDEDYRVASLRMTALARPALGKERFEMLAFAVSVLNGCESCVRSHEEALRGAGVPVAKIHDLARMAAVIKGLEALLRAA